MNNAALDSPRIGAFLGNKNSLANSGVTGPCLVLGVHGIRYTRVGCLTKLKTREAPHDRWSQKAWENLSLYREWSPLAEADSGGSPRLHW